MNSKASDLVAHLPNGKIKPKARGAEGRRDTKSNGKKDARFYDFACDFGKVRVLFNWLSWQRLRSQYRVDPRRLKPSLWKVPFGAEHTSLSINARINGKCSRFLSGFCSMKLI